MYDKNVDKIQRQPITSRPRNQGKNIRPNLNRNMKLDSEHYEALYPDKKFMKINDLDNEVQWWLDRGAVPVQRMTDQRKVYKGLNDKGESEYVNWHGGETQSGAPYKVWLLMMEPEDYHKYKIGPQEQRQAEIQKAMRIGKKTAEGESNDLTYAPNLLSGGKGFEQEVQEGLGPVNPIR